jgi:hypothetical protein
MAPTLTLHQGDAQRTFDGESLHVVTRRTAVALGELAQQMPEHDPLRHACNLLSLSLAARAGLPIKREED